MNDWISVFLLLSVVFVICYNINLYLKKNVIKKRILDENNTTFKNARNLNQFILEKLK